jgi:HlyD family secretion protein
MKTRRQHLIWIAGVLALSVALAVAFRPRPVEVDLARVVRGSLRVTVDEDGRTRIKERYIVSAPLGGQLRRIELEPGDCVVAGETFIGMLEPNVPGLIDARTRDELAARVRAAELQVQSAGTRRTRAQATRELAEAELLRVARLTDQGASSQQELDRSREAARAAEEDLKASGFAEQIAGFELQQARAALSRSAPGARNGEDDWVLSIVAPVRGRVLRVFQEDEAVVAAGARLVEIGDPADLEVEIDVLSSDAVQVQTGARVFFEHWGGDFPLEGRVRVVEPAGFLKISALGVEEQRVNVIVDLVTPVGRRGTLGDAYRVDARIVIWEADDVVKVPVGALFRSGEDWSVFLMSDGRARIARVDVGHSNGREAEILGGVRCNDSVVVHASDKVADGVRIKPRSVR